MTQLPMLDNIFAQPASHRSILEYQSATGRVALELCAERIRNTQGKIVFTGMGASLFAAIPAVGRLVQSGYAAQAVESSELLHYGSGALKSGDIGVLISRSGGSVEVLRLAEKMRAIGMTLIGVTNVPGSELEKLADISLLIGSLPDQLIAVQTYTGTVLALLLLAEQVWNRSNGHLQDSFRNLLPTLRDTIESCVQASESWRDIFDGGGALYLLGRGPALASVHEGALLLHETAKAPAVGMSSGQFRHGPVEWVSSDSRIVVFGAPEATRSIDRSLADDLSRMGAKVQWIGPSLDEKDSNRQHAPSLMRWPEIDPMLAPLFDIVPLQIAAYRLALWRDIVPGDFRYASEITSAESGFPLFQSRFASG